MTTLHIEHAIVDFELWNTAFERFAEARINAGVRSQRVSRPVDDPHYVIIDLGFDRVDQAADFLTFLQAQVWASAESSPALIGQPCAVIFETGDTQAKVSVATTHR